MLHRFLLVCRVLLAMARRRLWEPLLIIVAIVIATAGLSSVTLINQGASEGELASSQPGWFSGGSVTAKSGNMPISKADYVQLRRAGFTYLVAMTETDLTLTCDSNNSRALRLTVTGVDVTAALGNAGAFNGVADMAGRQRGRTENGESPAFRKNEAEKNVAGKEVAAKRESFTPVIPSAASPQTVRYLNCKNTLSGLSRMRISTPQAVTGLPDNRLMLPMDAFYSGERTPANIPLTAMIVARTLNTSEQQRLLNALPPHLKLTVPPVFTSKGTLADSFQLNLWAMGALMAVVSVFIILNALMLMYRARLPAFIRLRQAGVGSRMLLSVLFFELALYSLIATPTGVFCGAALTLALTPVLQATFSGQAP